MLRRPPIVGRGSSQQQKKLFLAFAFILLPWLQLTNAQHAAQSVIPQRPAGTDPAHWETAVVDTGAATIETPSSGDRKRSTLQDQPIHQEKQQQQARRSSKKNPPTNNNKKQSRTHHILIPDDASAIATLAPAKSVRAPSPLRHQRLSSVSVSGLASPHHARSLEDWKVEDFVLLATVDGDLFANDRKTGKQLWHLQVDQHMVETIHHRANSSSLEDDFSPVDHYIWAIEPNRDGGVYVWVPEPGARPRATGFTMKELVEVLSPYAGREPDVIYVGAKDTTIVTLDAATGRVLKWFGTGSSHVNEADSCLKPNALYDTGAEECSTTGTITLGRTEYTVSIKREDGKPIATLKYAEWTPNNRDKDLFHQYHVSMDNRYMTTRHDGKVYAFDYKRSDSKAPSPLFSQQFNVPVARVFDVCRPGDAAPESNPDLVLLSQPTMPVRDDTISNSIFLNRTETGGWYALSGREYPLIDKAPLAKVSLPESWGRTNSWDSLTDAKLSNLVGTHPLGAVHETGQQFPTLPEGTITGHTEDPDNQSMLQANAGAEEEESTIVDKVKNIPQNAANSVKDFVSNPVLIIFLIGFLLYNRKSFARAYQMYVNGSSPKDALLYLYPGAALDGKEIPQDDDSSESVVKRLPKPDIEEILAEAKSNETENKALDQSINKDDVGKQQPDIESAARTDTNIKPAESPSKTGADEDKSSEAADTSGTAQGAGPEGKKKKEKKAHRGRRGGVKHRKGRHRDNSQSRDDDLPDATVEEAVSNAKKLGDRPVWEPDVMTVANDMQAVSGPIIRMGDIEVDLEQQLGTGSNGTLVFAGNFDGREVAVKRMLIQFYDIASQETRLLRESDDHPNG